MGIPVKIILSMAFSDLKLFMTNIGGGKPVFDHEKTSTLTYKFSNKDQDYLKKLHNKIPADIFSHESDNDLDIALKAACWTSELWQHDGFNQATANDPISIIEQAQAGMNFRCVEYAIVLCGVMSALGYPSRVLGLMMQDVEIRRYGAGHLAVETFLFDRNRWIMIDGQFSVIPTVKNQPVNAVELSEALHYQPESVSAISRSQVDIKYYKKWIKPYLYYFQTGTDNCYAKEPKTNADLCLGPTGAPEPKRFQIDTPITLANYTDAIADFYPDRNRIIFCND